MDEPSSISVLLDSFRVVRCSLSFLPEEPRVPFHILIYGSGHTTRIDVWMSFRIYQRIFGFNVSDSYAVEPIRAEEKTCDEKCQHPDRISGHCNDYWKGKQWSHQNESNEKSSLPIQFFPLLESWAELAITVCARTRCTRGLFALRISCRWAGLK